MFTRALAIHSSVVTTLVTAFVCAGSMAAKALSFNELDVRRIDVRESDGRGSAVTSPRHSGRRRRMLLGSMSGGRTTT